MFSLEHNPGRKKEQDIKNREIYVKSVSHSFSESIKNDHFLYSNFPKSLDEFTDYIDNSENELKLEIDFLSKELETLEEGISDLAKHIKPLSGPRADLISNIENKKIFLDAILYFKNLPETPMFGN